MWLFSHIETLTMKSNALYLLVLIASCAFAQQVNAQCSSLYYPQSGRVWVNHDLGGLPNYTKYVRFKIDTPIPNPNVTLFIFQSPNGFLSYDPVNNRMGYGVTHNRQGCNCCGNGCSSTEGYTFASGLTLNEWHTVAIAVDSNDDVTIMLDGVIQSPVGPSFDGCCSGNYNYTVIGNLIGGNNPRGFYGWIDEAALWNTELSAADLIALNECDAAPLSSAYGYWDFNEGTGAVAVDQSGNGFDGNVQSLTYTDDTGDCCAAGCTDENAANYDPSALEDDGSCIFPGCTDQSADNYDPNANEDDGSCLFNGCTNPVACNYDANANSDDGSCILPGCTDDAACNYDPQAGCDDGSCAYTIDCAGICGGSFVNDECGNCYDPALANETVEVIFDYTGSAQSWVVPEGVTQVTFDVYGAQGSDQAHGGWGGRASGSLNVNSGDEYLIYVGGSGWTGGWNGGGNLASGNERRGGGASDIRHGGASLTDRIIVAGGGGVRGNATTSGCNSTDIPITGGAGGAETGETGGNGGTATGGTGGTQNAGGSPGSGNIGSGTPGTLGAGGNGFSNDAFGGGGGGYYGGGGGGTSGGCNRGAGGGGSNYIGGVTPILSESGVNEGSGQIIISYNIANVPDCVLGCTDDNADNYNAEATNDDGSCIYLGCTNEQADNYDPNANQDDGSCIFSGCTDQSADNYDPNANQDDGSCIFSGCTNQQADNYDPVANQDDGSCIFSGCTDSGADNYDPIANQDDGSCIFSGCTDENADNYDPQANNEDGSCIYLGCTDLEAANYDASANQDDGSCIYPGCTNDAAVNYDPQANQDDGSCIIEGCTYENAVNYNAEANKDDGTCIFPDCPAPSGCTDQLACNYSPIAITDDGSCTYDCFGCTYTTADNYDPAATVDDASCIFTAGSEFCADGTTWDSETETCIPLPDTCPEDFNDDGLVNSSDLLFFLGRFGGSCE